MANQKANSDPSAIVLPFGKHKGKTVAELLATDPQYADWVTAQAWVADRFAELHAAIISRGAGSDDSPEHNALQARFLDLAFCQALVQITSATNIGSARDECWNRGRRPLLRETERKRERLDTLAGSIKWAKEYGGPVNADGLRKNEAECQSLREQIEDLEQTYQEWPREEWPVEIEVTFELAGVDVGLDAFIMEDRDRFFIDRLKVEIKPSVGDDYPTVLRQMRRTKAGVLVVETFAGRGVSEPQMRAMFEASGIKVVFVQEIEERMRQT